MALTQCPPLFITITDAADIFIILDGALRGHKILKLMSHHHYIYSENMSVSCSIHTKIPNCGFLARLIIENEQFGYAAQTATGWWVSYEMNI
jgi:hypothetical protein